MKFYPAMTDWSRIRVRDLQKFPEVLIDGDRHIVAVDPLADIPEVVA